MASVDPTFQSPTKLRLHKRHYLDEVVRRNVDLRQRHERENSESAKVDFSNISRSSTFRYCTQASREEELLLSNSKAERGHRVKEAASPRKSESLEDSAFFDENKVERVFSIALTAVNNARETEEGDANLKDGLLQFVNECFDLPEERKKQLQETSNLKTVKKAKLKLTCRVQRAKELVIKDKDTTGTVEFYCQLGVLNENHLLEKDIEKQKKNLKEWQREKLVESSGRTSVISGTLEPEWKEVVELCVSKPRKEILVVEIWNCDESNGGITKKGSFVGRFFYPILCISSDGMRKTFKVHSHSGKTVRGSITLRLNIQREACLEELSELTCAVVNTCAKENGSYVRRWSGELAPMAEKLLEEYAVLNDIDDLCRACIRLSVLVKYHKLYAVNMAAICEMIRQIKHHTSLSSTTPPVSHDLWERLFVDLNELSQEMEVVMKNHLHMFNFELEADQDKIRECVQTLSELYSFQSFTKRLPPGSGPLKEMLEKCITAAVPRWFSILDAQMLPQVNTDKTKMVAFRDLSELCLQQCRVALKINPIFTDAGVHYFSIFYTALDPLLGKEPETRLNYCSIDSSDSTSYEIYLSYRDMAKLAQHIDDSELSHLYGVRRSLLLPQCHNSFEGMVKNWIELAAKRCNDLTVKAIEADSAIAVTDQVKFSTSAVDVTGFLLKLGNFWKNLEWPQAIAAYGFASTVMEEINSCTQFYVERVAKSLNSEDLFDEQGHFRASEKLCIVLNDMQHVRQWLCNLEEGLEFESFYKWLDTDGELNLGKRCKEMVDKLLRSADDDIYNRMSKIMAEITNKLTPDIQQYVRRIVSDGKTTTPTAEDDLEVMTPLMDFLTKNLQVFANHLFPAVLEIILGNLWQLSLGCVHKCLMEVQLKRGSNSAQLHKRSFTLLKALKDFYHVEGDGLKEEALKTDTYNRLFSQLEVLQLPTDELIFRFLSELAEFQHREMEGDKQLGALHISVCHNREESVVEVKVLSGLALPGMNKSGVCSPFIQVSLMPQWAFPKAGNTFKTSVQKKTVNPVYNEEFRIPATDVELKKEGAVLLLSVFDRNVVSADQFTGMCVVACKDIPPSTSDKQESNNELKLPLFRFIDMTFSFAEIEARANNLADGKANHFNQSIKKLLTYLPRPRSRSRSGSRIRSKSSVSNLEELQAQAVQLS